MKKFALITSALVSITLLAGCTAAKDAVNEQVDNAKDEVMNEVAETVTEKAVESAFEAETDEGAVDVEIEDGTTTITKEDGSTVSVGTSAIIPSNWPNDVPFPDAISVTTAGLTNSMFSAVFNSDEPSDVVASFYEDELESLGWTQNTETALAGYYVYTYEKNGKELNITILDRQGETAVTVAVDQ